MQEQSSYEGQDRRKTPRTEDTFYRVVLAINVVAWLVFLAAMIVFHYARPELVTGVQNYWGVEVRQSWSQSLTFYLLALLVGCVSLSGLTLVMKRRRNRRKNDYMGLNVIFLLLLASTGLAWIYAEMDALKADKSPAEVRQDH